MALNTITEHTIPVAIEYMVLSFVIALLQLIRRLDAVENSQAELANVMGIGYGVDGGDLPIRGRAFKYHQEAPPWGYQDSHGSVYEHGPSKLCTVLERGISHGLSTTDLLWYAHRRGGAVSSQHDVWVEQC